MIYIFFFFVCFFFNCIQGCGVCGEISFSDMENAILPDEVKRNGSIRREENNTMYAVKIYYG